MFNKINSKIYTHLFKSNIIELNKYERDSFSGVNIHSLAFSYNCRVSICGLSYYVVDRTVSGYYQKYWYLHPFYMMIPYFS